MSQPAFMSAIQKVTSGSLTFHELILAAQGLSGSAEPDLARQLYQVWMNFNRDHPLRFIAEFNCSTLMSQLGDETGAVEALQRALQVNPDFAPAHINLGSALERRGAIAEAVDQWRAGLDRMTAITGDAIEYKITLLKQISRVVTDNQQLDNAEVALSQCLDLNPQQRDVAEQYAAVRLAQCKWPIATGLPKMTRASFVSRFHPLSVCAYADDPLLQLGMANRYVQATAPVDSINLKHDRRHAPTNLTGRRPRIGYVSSDLRHHAVGYLMARFFEQHDPEAVEVFVYYCGIPADDSISRRIKAVVPHWTDIRGLTDDQAAEKIAADGIDILVDVNGHTREARIGLFARRPAPIQVNWLGYPGTMGTPFHNYIIGDEWTIPNGAEIYYSEKVLRLPCYQPNDPHRTVDPHTPSRADFGLPDDAFVFCSFNAPHKITRYSFERWLDILAGTPGSVLWLLDCGPETGKRLAGYAEARGISGDRLVFAPKIANPKHLARYPLADLFIDTAPYGAHTTASDALWMGVPVLTLSGRCFASRVCGGLLRAAGLPELVCEDPDAFVARAIALAGASRAELQALRDRLIAGRSTCTLFDTEKLARSIETLYRQMCADHQKGRTPQPRLTNLDAYADVGVAMDHDAREVGMMADYHGLYRSALAERHRLRPLEADQRLWTSADIDVADASPLSRVAGEIHRAA